ncbi:uncharacterized protein (TIGR02611 family) [Krasilnikovia cinnamomea]|uniref:Uncharacterized protein (TIGR02611 family) n=1 Tax=Krasilnikovia cinnamomea TaxID=349313 RepID=A0A4Q7ZGE7_9ACTN|nr:TIGR02611 family protein [Krasilnikovia cinnamomea]RZU49205.1 uncharacterized protein (TIGR02611 family) [Krasilnikovia cinnamomea]
MPRTDRVSDEPRTEESHGPIGLLHRIRANPSGRVALKVGIGVVGGLVVALGVVLIPFPGPGWAIVILGLAILALEFAWAQHVLEFTKRHVQSWTHWATRQSLPVRLLIGALGMVFVAAILWVSVKLSFGVDLAALAWGWLGGS